MKSELEVRLNELKMLRTAWQKTGHSYSQLITKRIAFLQAKLWAQEEKKA